MKRIILMNQIFAVSLALGIATYDVVAIAQEATPPAATDTAKKPPVPQVKPTPPAPTEPILIRLPTVVPQAMICQPRSSICVSCSDTDPCYMYQAVRRTIGQEPTVPQQ